MNFKNLLKLGTLTLLVTLVLSSLSYGQTIRYLNSTDGDDSYTGENPTNNPLGTGPKRTLEGAFDAFASGTTVYMAAGIYNYNQSGIGGGNDANGYTLPTVAGNKSMTFIVQTYNANNVVTLNGGPLVIQSGTGTVKFEAATAGVQSITFSGAGLTLTSGTLDVSGITFNATANPLAITRTEGAVVGTPVYTSTANTVLYNGTTSKTAGGEMPATINTLTFSQTAASTITFNNAITFGTTGGGITNTLPSNNAVFNGKVSLTAPAAVVTPTIVNSQATSTWTFAGGIDVNSTVAANGIVIDVTGAGTINVTGQLTFYQRDITGTNDGNNTSTVQNTAGGTLGLTGGVVEVATAFGAGTNFTAARTSVVNFVNNAGGTANLGGGTSTTFTGTFTTGAAAGLVNIVGPVSVSGVLTNGAGHTIALGTNTLTLSNVGAHTNTGNVTSTGVGSGELIFNKTTAGAITWNGAGNVPNIKNSGAGGVTLAAATNINGNVTNTSSGLITLTAASTITGGITISSSGGVTLGAVSTVQGPTAVNGSGTLTTNVTTFQNTVTITAGGFTLGGNVTVFGDFSQSGGTLTFTTFTLDIKANFSRTAGTVVPGTGTLQFSAGGNQQFTGGTNLQVWNLVVTSVGTGVVFNNGSLEVLNNATIIANTNVQLGTYNIRMLGGNVNGVGNNTFTNGGQYTSTGGGGVIFEAPVGITPYISGNGVNSNIEVRLATETQFVDVSDGQTVTWSGLLTLTRGTIRVGNGAGAAEIFNPSNLLTTPTIRRNLADSGDAGTNADGYPINVGVDGTFNLTAQSYHLVYFGAGMGQVEVVGPEFVAGANPRVIDLTVTATGNIVQLGNAEYRFTGNLFVGNSSNLQLNGAGNNPLVSTGAAVTHTINGKITRTNTGTFTLAGGGTVNGGTQQTTAPVDDAEISDLTVNTTGTYAINNMKLIGTAGTDALNVVAGTVNLGMQTLAGPTPGDLRNVNITGGTLNLTKDADYQVAFTITGGTFDFADNNLYNNVAGGTFTATGGTLLATGATTKGWLVYDANGNITTGTINVPRIYVGLNAASVLTLTGNTGFSDLFTLARAGSSVELNANTFRFVGNTFTYSAGTIVSTAGNGLISVTGPTEWKLAANLTVPNVTVNNGTNVSKLTDNDGAAGTVPTLSISDPGALPGLFTMTAGSFDLQTVDVQLSDAGAVFVYTAGTLSATSNTTSHLSTDNQNGEFVFNNAAAQTFAVGTTVMVMPNLRIQGAGAVSLSTTNPFTISKRLVYGAGGGLTFGANGRMTLGDGAWVEVRGASLLSHTPTFAGVVDINYASGATIPVDKEMPAAGATLRRLFVNSPGFTINATKNILVNSEFHLIAGTYDPEPGATTYTVEMASGSTVNVQDGVLANNAAATFGLTGGPITLQYTNTAARNTSPTEYPATAGFVSILKVMSTAANAAAQGGSLGLHANRSAGDFVLETGTATPLVANLIFNLNGFTLTVTNTASSTLTRGVLSSIDEGTDIYAFATLASSGPVTSTANATITNTNITAPSLNLAGAFGKQDYNLDAAANNTLPAGFPSATISGPATVAAFAGNLTATGNITINGAHSNGTITASGDVTVATGGNMAASSNLTFIGTANATFTVPTAGATIGGMTLNKTNNTNTITLTGGNLATTAVTNFVNGLFITGSNTLRLFHPLFGGGQGFTRVGVTGTNISHVVGNVAKNSVNAGGPGLGGSSEPRFEFPVGTTTLYRPVAITFNPSFGLPTMPNATFTVSHVNANPGGAVELPIKDGVAPGIDVARYPAFYWTIASSPFSIGPSTLFDLELTATGFTDYDDVNNVRIIRRHGQVTDVTNQWLLQGQNDQYDNELNAGVPSIIQKNANAGLRLGGAVFTLGLKSNMKIKTSIPKQWLVLSAGAKNYSLANLFEGNIGSLTYTAQTSNASIATVAVSGTTLTVTPIAIGDAVITIVASDAANNDFFAYSFPVNVGLVGVEDGEIIPTEFSLAQNFPNPFNPTTNIKFGLPKESNVTLRIFNILGEEVATLVNKVMPAGFHTVNFDASRLTSGLYIYRIEADNFVQVKKMMLMK